MVVPQAPGYMPAPQAGNTLPAGRPGSVSFLVWYYMIGAIPVMLFSLFGFTIPVEELTNHPEYIERDRGFLTAIKVLMFGGLLLYSGLHLLAGFKLLGGKKSGYIIAKILSILGIFHLNPFAVPGLIVLSKKDVQQHFGIAG
jgi:hypothetical protein